VVADRRVCEAAVGLGRLVGCVLGKVVDRDSRGDPYAFSGVPGCPACGSTYVADFFETEEPWPFDAAAVGHSKWDHLGSEAKIEKVRVVLDELLDTATTARPAADPVVGTRRIRDDPQAWRSTPTMSHSA
jgi:hypothetical protein